MFQCPLANFILFNKGIDNKFIFHFDCLLTSGLTANNMASLWAEMGNL